MKKFFTFGEPMVMFIAEQEGALDKQRSFEKFMAGAEVNTAIGMARLGYEAYFASRVGNDSFGHFIISELTAQNIKTDHVIVDKNWPTGFQLKSRVHIGDPEVEYYRQFSAFRQQSEKNTETAALQNGAHLHVTGIPLALSESVRKYSFAMIKKARENNIAISFDPNLRPNLWSSIEEMRRVVNQAAVLADCVLPGIKEGMLLTGEKKPFEIARFYLKKGVKLVIIKLGSEGAYYCDKNSREGLVKGIKNVRVVDTVGAGDGFAVGAVSALMEGLDIESALRRGNAIGALVVQHSGDNEGLPDRKTLDSYIKQSY